jgi:hypothetical protein
VKPIQNPADRLSVRHQKVEVIQAELVLPVEDPGHHSMDGKRGDCGAPLLARSAKDEIQRRVVVHRID